MPSGVRVTSVATGLYHSLALGSDGNVYAWGYNGNGEIGNDTDVNSSTPVKSGLPAGASPTAIGAGIYDSYALLANGTLDAWGQNGFGQLGNGTFTASWLPVAVELSANATFTSLASDSSSDFALAIATPSLSMTTTDLSPSSSSPVYGQAETLTATVTSSDGGGTVNFEDGSTSLSGCSSVSLTQTGATYQAQCTTSTLSAGQHDLTAVYSGDSSSQGSTSSAVVLTVATAPLTITGSSGAATYGGAPPAVTASYAGFVNGDSAASLTASPTCSTTATTTSPVGTYATTCIGASAANCSITYQNGEVVIDPAPLSISASSGTMTYGSAPPSIDPGYAGFVNGDTSASLTADPTCSTVATSSSAVGNYASTCTGAADPNYLISYTDGQVVVGAAPLVVTASSVATTYGTASAAITPAYSGFLNGDTSASLTTQPTCTTSASVTSPVGTYPSSCSGATDPNYAITYVDGTATIAPAPITITASSDSTTYGGSAPGISPIVAGLQNGEGASVLGGGLQCSTDAAPASPVGTYGASCSGASDPNYTISYVDGTVTVSPAPLAVTASSGSMTYGGSVPTITPTIGGLQNGETASILGAGFGCATGSTSTSPVGSYASTCSGASDPNYTVSYAGGTVTVTPAPLTITASSGTMTYGDSPPAIVPLVAGLQNGEDISVLGPGLMCSTSAISSSPIGPYASTCSGAVDTNYTISYVDGTVDVVAAPLLVAASSGSMSYGGTPPAIQPTYSGFVNGESSAALATQPTCTTGANSNSPVGTYSSNCSGASDPNYAISYVAGDVVVGTSVLVISASSATETYGSAPSAITPSYSGFVNGDAPSSLATPPTCTSAATAGSPVGSYTTGCTGAADPNYTIEYVAGSAQVQPAPLAVSASSATMTYGGTKPVITPNVTGLVNGDSVAALGAGLTCTTAAGPTSTVGSYSSTCSGASDPNYSITYASGTVTVGPAILTVTANNQTMQFGGTVPTLTYTITGFVNGQTLATSGVSGQPACTTTATSVSRKGTYPITCTVGTLSASSYIFTFVAGTLTIGTTRDLDCHTEGDVWVLPGWSYRLLPGCHVHGSVHVEQGGSFDDEGGNVSGSIDSEGGAVRICNSYIMGGLIATSSTQLVDVGDGSPSCGGSTLLGGVELSSDSGGVRLVHAHAVGAISVTQNAGEVDVESNRVTGSLSVGGNSGTTNNRSNNVYN